MSLALFPITKPKIKLLGINSTKFRTTSNKFNWLGSLYIAWYSYIMDAIRTNSFLMLLKKQQSNRKQEPDIPKEKHLQLVPKSNSLYNIYIAYKQILRPIDGTTSIGMTESNNVSEREYMSTFAS